MADRVWNRAAWEDRHPMRTATEALDALRALPTGAHVLGVLADHPEAWVVGGAVRDALLARPLGPDVDVTVVGDPEPVARALGAVEEAHGRFGTYVVRTAEGGEVDVVTARRETYDGPGALPRIVPGGLEDDLLRRDFTVNALALNADGELHAAPAALDDLEARRLRIFHAASFRDDPTRLWRLVRYAVRLSFVPEPATDRLAQEAVERGALQTVSGDRLGAELRLALREPDPLSVLHAAQNLGLVEGLALDPALVARALALLPGLEPHPPRGDLATLGAVIPDAAWADGWGFDARELAVLRACAEAEPLRSAAPSAVVSALRGVPVEAVAVAGARGDGDTALRYLNDWRHVRLRIDGSDLLAEGIPEGQEIGRRLAATLAARLDGALPDDRDAQLAFALRADC
jgi:tRNA nucleotidyltransferase (CCA-adding enzyme)